MKKICLGAILLIARSDFSSVIFQIAMKVSEFIGCPSSIQDHFIKIFNCKLILTITLAVELFAQNLQNISMLPYGQLAIFLMIYNEYVIKYIHVLLISSID